MRFASFPDRAYNIHRGISVDRDVHTEEASGTSPDSEVSVLSNQVEVPRVGLQEESSRKGSE